VPSSRLPVRSAALASVFLLPGCLGLDVAPGFQLRQSIVAEGMALPESVQVFSRNGTIGIAGQIVGKLPCDMLGGEVKESGKDLRIIITLDAERNYCNGIAPTTFSFVASVVAIDPGSHNVVVEYHYKGTNGQNGVVADQLVSVGQAG